MTLPIPAPFSALLASRAKLVDAQIVFEAAKAADDLTFPIAGKGYSIEEAELDEAHIAHHTFRKNIARIREECAWDL